MNNVACKVSVIVATYNGAKYLQRQFDSIRMQELQIDQVLIGDDCSNDCTASFTDDYIRKYNLTKWNLIRRKENIGWRANFIDLLKKSDGDYVFFSDQDDVWYPNKCKVLVDYMRDNPEALCVASDYDVNYVDKDGKIAKLKTEKNDMNERVENVLFDKQFNVIKRPGCSYCMSREMVNMIVNSWRTRVAHDALAWTLALTMGRLYIIHEKLFMFQRHLGSVTSLRTIFTRKQMVGIIQDVIELDQSVINACVVQGLHSENIGYVRKHKAFLERRKEIFVSKSILHLFLFQICNAKYYPKVKSLIADYLYIIKEE